MKKKLIALLLCITMIGSMTVYAVGDEPTCTCGAEVEEHAEDCACYVAPECDCGSEGDGHAEDCPAHIWGEDGYVPAKSFTSVAELTKAQIPSSTHNAFTPTDNANIVTSKTVSYNETDDNYTIKLETHATGKSVTTQTEKTLPSDIVLVLDLTNSMKYCIKCGHKFGLNNSNTSSGCGGEQYCIKRITAMYDAVEAFLQEVEKSDVDHRVAIATFSMSGNNNTVLFYNNNGNVATIKNYGTNPTNTHYSKALFSLDAAGTVRSKLMTELKSFGTQPNTYPGDGMEMAVGVFANNPLSTDEERNRVVVFLSDGIPTNVNTANNALTYSSTCINTYGATVYTVGIFGGADASTPTTLTYNNSHWNHDNETTVPTANSFMQLLSSNYPDVKPQIPTSGSGTLSSSGYVAPANGGSYYLTAADAGDLTSVFTTIAESATSGGSSIKLDSTTEVRDEISSDFEIVYDAGTGKPKVSFYTMSYSAKDTWVKDETVPTGVTATVTDSVISVTGFDFSENWVGEHVTTAVDGTETTEYRGKKLVVEVEIVGSSTNIGGEMMATNVPGNSGIFVGGTALENFDKPVVDIPAARLTLVKAGQELTAGDLFNFTIDYVEFDGYKATDDQDSLDAIGKNVRMTTTLGIGDAQTFGRQRNREIYPDNVMNALAGTKISFTEEANPDYEIASVVVSYEENGEIVSETLVADNGAYTTVVRPDMTITFTNIPTKADLLISKTVDIDDPKESFLFNISGEGLNMQVLIPASAFVEGNGQVCIKNLQVGNYTVTELTDDGGWNWRWTLKNVSAQNDKAATISGVTKGISFRLTAAGETISFVNESTNNFWLAGENFFKNLFNGRNPTPAPTPTPVIPNS